MGDDGEGASDDANYRCFCAVYLLQFLALFLATKIVALPRRATLYSRAGRLLHRHSHILCCRWQRVESKLGNNYEHERETEDRTGQESERQER